MGKPLVIYALIAKRAELAGLLLQLDRQKVEVAVQIEHIDHALAIFAYEGDPRGIKPRRKHVYRFKRRELPALMREIEADSANLTSREAALRIIAAKGWDTADRALVTKVTECVKSQKGWRRRSQRSE